MFTPGALENIAKTGNVWGTTTEYVYKFTVRLPFRWYVNVEQRRKNQMWGRFGGGWNWKLGMQAGGTTLIVDLLVVHLRFGRAQ